MVEEVVAVAEEAAEVQAMFEKPRPTLRNPKLRKKRLNPHLQRSRQRQCRPVPLNPHHLRRDPRMHHEDYRVLMLLRLATTPSTELPTPISRPSNSNRRRRSQTNKAPVLPNITSPAPDDNLLRPDRPVLPSVPHTAPPPGRDAPPHLSNNHSHSPAEMRTNIDALVERVRAVAMAENRPSTPGSHIDWAGDDDDSLPDLNDWGISTIAPAQTISPIIVDGLKPLPEPISKPIVSHGAASRTKPSPLANSVALSPSTSRESTKHSAVHKEPGPAESATKRGRGNNNAHPSLPPRPISVSTNAPPPNRWGMAPPMRTPPFNQTAFAKAKEALKSSAEAAPASSAPEAHTEAAPDVKVIDEPPTVTVVSDDVAEVNKTSPVAEKKASPESIRSASALRDPLFGGIGNAGGLSASIHAPKSMSDSTSAPANLSTYDNLPRAPPPREAPFTHTRRPASFNSQPPRNPRSNNSGPRAYNHARNHSSPHSASVDGGHRLPHARPVINAEAISRLARTIVSTTPKSAPVVGTSNE
ncbi:hypothetical protein DFP72DRAFT_566907 [Ephemerocybe angulata]|uniref:Uncharacterized protein n=1 Tax=Ephemerocybe angulata TaxID=980116 RepID=A0A8H6IEA6_9AGAR|nr:hypothetical protein DFP72DRAFT_566907 [Tulosesus angulatus]